MTATPPQPTGARAGAAIPAAGDAAKTGSEAVAAAPSSKAPATSQASASPTGPPVARPEARATSTPKLVRGWLMFTTLSLVAFTVLGVLSLLNTRDSLSGAGEAIGQLSRVEQIRTDLLRADASAAHLLLGSGESEYQEALGQARTVLVETAVNAPDEAAALAEVNRDLDAYAAKLEEARVGRNSPAGEAALIDAGQQLRTGVLPALDEVVRANSDLVDERTRTSSSAPLVVSGIAALVGLVGTALSLSIRFHRVVNLGLAAALLLVAAAFAFGQWTLGEANTLVDQQARRAMTTFQETAAARGSAYNARAQEALALIQRRDDAAADTPWATAADDTRAALDRIPDSVALDLTAAWDLYARAHADVRDLAGRGQWDEAQRHAVHQGTDAAGARFAEFDEAVTSAMTSAGATSGRLVKEPRLSLEVAALGVGVAGFAAILCSWAGVRPRLREYA
ncbi:hypothetical protein [Granulicoccus sp. GXG6511]|uniref:hypothetical protein n=1 Tax=Granulicoccus sp. GXG6511 TaxID=3381351 RepID=UPI003D7D9E46